MTENDAFEHRLKVAAAHARAHDDSMDADAFLARLHDVPGRHPQHRPVGKAVLAYIGGLFAALGAGLTIGVLSVQADDSDAAVLEALFTGDTVFIDVPEEAEGD